MIDAVQLGKRFGAKVLFSGVDLHVGPSDRIAVVGPNGCGKSTFFKILLGLESPDDGRVERKKGLRLGYLPQDVYPSIAGESALLDYCVHSVRGVGDLVRERDHILGRVEKDGGAPPDLMELWSRLTEVEEALAQARYDSLPSEAESVLLGLGFQRQDLRRPVNTLSGGLLMRAHLARLLLDEPELLVLDEPLNHLDLEGILWLEQYLARFKGAIMLVAHDREFLDKTVHRVVELTRFGTFEVKALPNAGAFERYEQEREKMVELQWKRYHAQQARIREIEEFIARNRVRKDRAQLVQSRIRMLENMERIEPPEPLRRINFRFPQPPRAPDIVVRMERLCAGYGERLVLHDINLTLRRADKVALVGLNGSGKSTLLKLLARKVTHASGDFFLAPTVQVGYYAQDQMEQLEPDRTVMQHMLDVCSVENAAQVRPILGAFRFEGDDVHKKVAALSGGEKARLMMAMLLVEPKGLLLLDEPTNHLDVESRQVLERAMKEFTGTLVFTSHDRWFMDRVATSIVEIHSGRSTRYDGSYSYYARKTGGILRHAQGLASRRQRERPHEERGKKRRREQKARRRGQAEARNRVSRRLGPWRHKVERLEKEIEKAERELEEIEDRLVSSQSYGNVTKTIELSRRSVELRNRVERLYEEWAAAADRLESMQAGEDDHAV